MGNTISQYKIACYPAFGIIPISVSIQSHRLSNKRYWYKSILTFVFFSLLFNFIYFPCISQNILVFEFHDKTKKTFHVKDDISLFIKGDEKNFSGAISEINDSTFSLEGNEISISQIDLIAIYRRPVGILQEIFAKAGVGFFMIDFFNTAINRDSPVFEKKNIIVSSLLVASSIVLLPFVTKNYAVGKKNKLTIVSKQLISKNSDQ